MSRCVGPALTKLVVRFRADLDESQISFSLFGIEFFFAFKDFIRHKNIFNHIDKILFIAGTLIVRKRLLIPCGIDDGDGGEESERLFTEGAEIHGYSSTNVYALSVP